MTGKSMNRDILKITAASAVGTLFEWYDFLCYGVAAALVFKTLFFPTVDPMLGMMAALLTQAVGFVARPLGGAIFGHYSDKLGRKSVLMITMTLMGLGTVCIGLLPTYAQIGIWAPVLLVLLRICQGIGFGGEWGSAALMVYENAPDNRKGFYTSFIQVGYALGLLMATGAFALVSRLPQDDLMSWGWRLPFLASFVLVLMGAYVRSRLSETPVFQELQQKQIVSKNPLKELITQRPRALLIAIGSKITEVSWSYMLSVFVIAYATTNLDLPKPLFLTAIVIANAINLIAIPLFGYLSDLIGRRILFYVGCAFTVVVAFPMFDIFRSGNTTNITIMVIMGVIVGGSVMFSCMAAYMAELFKPQLRSTGMSLSNQVGAAIGGGLSPIMAAAMIPIFGGTTGASVMMICFAIITAVCAYASNSVSQ
jgi:MHS family shikimate/dehydroshikimate transporter-like MFS transporter